MSEKSNPNCMHREPQPRLMFNPIDSRFCPEFEHSEGATNSYKGRIVLKFEEKQGLLPSKNPEGTVQGTLRGVAKSVKRILIL